MNIKQNRIGVIGCGFVGNAVVQQFKKKYDEVNIYDTDKEKCTHYNMSAFLNSSDVVFICVPTPMGDNGECDTSIVQSVIDEIANNDYEDGQPIILKSTVVVGTTKRLQERHPHLNLFFNPEFLREKNAVNDYLQQTRIILGHEKKHTGYYLASLVRQIFDRVFPKIPFIMVDTKTAEMVKYVTNTYLATKVSFANEINKLCELSDIDYDDMMDIAQYDKRLGYSHWQVPGHDGYYGYGGTCFPKDLSALTHYAEGLGLNPKMLKATAETNLEVRFERKPKEASRQTEKI